ncbi:MAG TPA: DUF4168 domain-containing protein [Candidimonas sp.]|nr:DUF4168 domain-containing protein [Candidimonas sp.]
MQKWITTTLSASVLAVGILSTSAMAQQAPAAAAPAQNYSDAQLEKFISASQKIAMISQEYTPKLQASENEATKQQVYKQADEKMILAVHEEGMTVDQFNGINQALQQNPELAQRAQKMVK